MKSKLLLRITLVAVLVSGCFSGTGMIAQGAEAIEGPADLHGAYNVAHSPYYVKHDYFNMKSHGSLVILSNFPTIQQTTEYSCGPAAAVMVLKYFNSNSKLKVRDLCVVRNTSNVKGTTS